MKHLIWWWHYYIKIQILKCPISCKQYKVACCTHSTFVQYKRDVAYCRMSCERVAASFSLCCPWFIFDCLVHQTFCILHRKKLGPEIMEAKSMQVNKWIILKRACLWIPRCGMWCSCLEPSVLLVWRTLQEPDRLQASLNNVWHLPTVLFCSFCAV